MGLEITLTGIVSMLFGWVMRKLSPDDADKIPELWKWFVVVLFVGGIVVAFVGMLIQVWE